MSNITKHERPGVYSAYEASFVVNGAKVGAAVGLAALCQKGTVGETQSLFGYEEAAAFFGPEEKALRLTELLFRNGAFSVVFSPVKVTGDYKAALEALGLLEDLPILLCDATEEATQLLLKETVEGASALRREKIGIVAGAPGSTASQLLERAAALGSERMILVAPEAGGEALPGASLAAAVAGALAGETDPALPLGGAVLRGIGGLSQTYHEEAMDSLIRGGVTVCERVGGEVSVVRGVTTRTKTGSVPDSTWREISTIRIVDDVIPSLRNALRARFSRSKNTEQVRNAIRSQVILELEAKLSREIITGYGDVTVKADVENPTLCLVTFSFTVAHGLNQIWLSARITV